MLYNMVNIISMHHYGFVKHVAPLQHGQCHHHAVNLGQLPILHNDITKHVAQLQHGQH